MGVNVLFGVPAALPDFEAEPALELPACELPLGAVTSCISHELFTLAQSINLLLGVLGDASDCGAFGSLYHGVSATYD